MLPILVIGYGNTLRADDGFGPLAAELVEARHLSGVRTEIAHQLNPEMAEDLSRARFVVFIDAARAQSADSNMKLAVRAVETLETLSTPATHHFEPESLLTFAKAVYGHAPAAVLITAETHNFDHGDQMSPAIRQAAILTAEAVSSLAAGDQLTFENLRRQLT